MIEFIRKHLATLPAYTPIEPFEVLSKRLGFPIEQIIKLDANENPYGPSPKAKKALMSLTFPHIYPDPESRSLRSALSQFFSYPHENILCGSGADELIDLILRVTLEKDDLVLSFPPTFGMYPFDTLVNAGKIIEIPRLSDFSIDLQKTTNFLNQKKVKVIFLATPNNPDGSMVSLEALNTLLEYQSLVVVDEAYIEFCDDGEYGKKTSLIYEVLKRENLIVLRTFSKWAGLAGLRVGYGCFPSWIMPILWKAKQPYNVNVAASEAAIASLDDIKHLAETINTIVNEREKLMQLLNAIPFLSPYPSKANFILCKVKQNDNFSQTAEQIKTTLAKKYGILVRYFNKPGLQDHLRFSIGKPEHHKALVHALNEIYYENIV